ncbi:hypothetical protein Tco_0455032 [Tanacetum coccineum]
MKKERRMISKDGTIFEFPGYTSSKEERKKMMKEKRKKRKRKTSDNEVESDLESTARSERKCKEIEGTCESGIRPKPDSS